MPLIYNKAVQYLNNDDIHIARFSNEIPSNSSYYEKLYTYKIKKLSEYIKNNIFGKYEFMLFVDATDTNFYKNPSTLIDDFLKFNKSIVFNAEKELWPETEWTVRYAQKNITGPFPYLNSGVYIGYVEKIHWHLENIIKNDYTNRVEDQSAWTIEYLLHDDIEIDSHGKLFFSSHKNKSYVSFDEDAKLNVSTSPYVVHDNGPFLEETIKIAELI
jgi:hypothetical protein